ncbi:hypothetical protein [Azospirillum rugosum]|uniref:Uncharacterized protein n=1 Tax=Azospirillum rugosum TaxID=416170 RepID=A0ABS4SR12_9PROT|nr:hypothetical protein [Azospirillum rugosum]MDQ0528803.1 hypothetical protein [Azospirillum rugosum]
MEDRLIRFAGHRWNNRPRAAAPDPKETGRISGVSWIVAAVSHTKPMLRVLAAGFGFDGIAGPLGIARAGEPLRVLLLGRSIHLWARSRRGCLCGLLGGRFAEPRLPTGSTARRVVKRHEGWSSAGVRAAIRSDQSTLNAQSWRTCVTPEKARNASATSFPTFGKNATRPTSTVVAASRHSIEDRSGTQRIARPESLLETVVGRQQQFLRAIGRL